MSLRLRALERRLPAWAARSAVRRLFEATATAFGLDPPPDGGLDHGELLERYVSFTTRSAERVLTDGTDLDAVSRRMRTNAHRLGASLRRTLGVRTRAEALRALRVAYRTIGIDLRADAHGDVVVERCAFAARSTPEVCALMSSLDEGVVAGLTRGGRLTFSERITEGHPRCLARIAWQGA